MTKAKTATSKDIDLNRWCVEMAMRWPVHSTGGGYEQHGPKPRGELDADVLGRAEKIKAWVSG